MDLWGIIEKLIPYGIGIILPIYTLRHTRKLKELELSDNEKNRNFQLEKMISEESLKVMAVSYHLVHKINRGLNFFNSVDEEGKKAIYQEVKDAREYWEKNLFYLPVESRRLIIPFTNMTFSSFNDPKTGFMAQNKAFEKVTELFTSIEKSFAKIMEKYNLFDK